MILPFHILSLCDSTVFVQDFDLSAGEKVLKVAFNLLPRVPHLVALLHLPRGSGSIRRSPTRLCVTDALSLYISCTDALSVSATSRYCRSRWKGKIPVRPVVAPRGGNIGPSVTLTERLNSGSVQRSPTRLYVTGARSLYISCTDTLGVPLTNRYRRSRWEGKIPVRPFVMARGGKNGAVGDTDGKVILRVGTKISDALKCH